MTALRRNFLATAATGLALASPTLRQALAQGKTARLVVPFPAGGGTDAAARVTAERIRSEYPAGLLVENRSGASGRVGVEFVKGSEADGLTMLFVPDFVMTIFPHSFRRLAYQPLQDFSPVALCAKTGYTLAAGPGLPAQVTTVPQFVAWCKANPRQASFASTSPGSVSHFTGLMLARAIGVDLLHVPYKGGAPALQDLMAGQIPVSISPVGEVLPHLKGDKVRVLATSGAQRSRFIPDAPTFAESGLKDVTAESWIGVFMPARTPPDAVAKASAALNAALQRQDVRESYAAIGMDTVTSTPAGFAATVRDDIERWGPIVRASGFTAEE